MPLAAGARLGPYEILSPLGAGGMGEVCATPRAPAKLGRDVAIKVHRRCSPRWRRWRSGRAWAAAPSTTPTSPRLRRGTAGMKNSSCSSAWRGRLSPTSSLLLPCPSRRLCESGSRSLGTRGGPRSGRRPSRLEARQHQDPPRRLDQDPRLRAGEGRCGAQWGPDGFRFPDGNRRHPGRRHPGDRGLHEPGAGAGSRGRPPQRHLLL